MNRTSGIEFRLHDGWGDFQVLWCMKYELDKAYNGYLKDGILVWEEIVEGVDVTTITPFMKVNRWFPMQEMIDALTKGTKIEPTKQVAVDAELKATKIHLEDMRKLVFKEPEVIIKEVE